MLRTTMMHSHALADMLALMGSGYYPIPHDAGAQVNTIFRDGAEYRVAYRACRNRRFYYSVTIEEVKR